MKTRKKISARLLVIMLVATLLLPFTWNVPVEAAETKQIDVLFSHDTHSHLNSFFNHRRWRTKRGWRICKDQNADR